MSISEFFNKKARAVVAASAIAWAAPGVTLDMKCRAARTAARLSPATSRCRSTGLKQHHRSAVHRRENAGRPGRDAGRN